MADSTSDLQSANRKAYIPTTKYKFHSIKDQSELACKTFRAMHPSHDVGSASDAALLSAVVRLLKKHVVKEHKDITRRLQLG